MRAERSDRISAAERAGARRPGGARRDIVLIAVALAAVGLIAYALLTGDPEPAEEPTEVAAADLPVPAGDGGMMPDEVDAPDIPEPEQEPEEAAGPVADAQEEPVAVDEEAPGPTAGDAAPAAPEPEPLSARDPEVRELFAANAGDAVVDSVLGNSNLLERGAAGVDAVRRGLVPAKLLNLPRVEEDFPVLRDGSRLLMDPAGFERYNGYISQIVAVPPERIAGAFQRFRPFLERAYGDLGYRGDQVDNALIAALDRIIATPKVAPPIELERAGAVFAFADRRLEGLRELEKLIIRTGPENQERLQTWAAELRRALLDS